MAKESIKVYSIDKAETLFILAHFDDKELEVIERYNKMVGDIVNLIRFLPQLGQLFVNALPFTGGL